MVVVGKPDFGCFGVGLDGVSAVATNDEAVYGYRSGIAGDAQTRIAVDKTIADSGHGSDLSMYYYP